MNEPAVVLTDFAITALCLSFCWRLWVRGRFLTGLQRYFFGLFAAIGLAAALGGLVHGFFDPADSAWNAIFWRLTLVAVGLSSYNLWLIDFRLLFNERMFKSLRNIVRVLFLGYILCVLFLTDEFFVAILSYIPPALVLLLILVMRVMRERAFAYVAGLVGLILTFIAAYIQQAQIGVHPEYFNHNALYHLVQALGLTGLYIFARKAS